jgi:2-polyprenyl-3-methyl-5-hydroxy-6-metoxy-1,4-benzoquinol methylase
MTGHVAVDDWDTHWRDFAEATRSNPAFGFRRRLVRHHIGLRRNPSHILDIGSGQGEMALWLSRKYPQASFVGLELSLSGVEFSKRAMPAGRFLQRDLTTQESPPAELKAWADTAVCSEVIEHLDRPVTLLRNAVSYCQPGCRIVVTVPGGPMSAFDHHIGHRTHYTPDALRCVLRSAGLEVLAIGGAGFPLFNLYRLVVITRGASLARDVAASQREVSPLARFAMAVFRAILGLQPPIRMGGWQIVAVARVPMGDSAPIASR